MPSDRLIENIASMTQKNIYSDTNYSTDEGNLESMHTELRDI